MNLNLKLVFNDTDEIVPLWTITKEERIIKIMSEKLSLPSHEINDFISGAKTKIIAKRDIEMANQTIIFEFERY